MKHRIPSAMALGVLRGSRPSARWGLTGRAATTARGFGPSDSGDFDKRLLPKMAPISGECEQDNAG